MSNNHREGFILGWSAACGSSHGAAEAYEKMMREKAAAKRKGIAERAAKRAERRKQTAIRNKEICRRIDSGETQASIAREFGLSRGWVGSLYHSYVYKKTTAEIRARVDAGQSWDQVANDLNMTVEQVQWYY